jgi:Helix-turn-helix
MQLNLADLKAAGAYPGSFTLIPLVKGPRGNHFDHVIRIKLFGGPQSRHRVIHRTYISYFERGARNPTVSIVEKLATSLGTTACELLNEYS